MTSFFASDSTADLSADSTIQALPHATSRHEPKRDVSAAPGSLSGGVLQDPIQSRRAKRLRYLASLIYWTVRHRSLSRGRWVAAYEHGSMK